MGIFIIARQRNDKKLHLPLKRIELNTEKLIQKSVRGNSKAQKNLYEKYVGLLFSTVFRYVKNENDAEDILLQAFLKIFLKLKDFQFINENAFIGWMKKVAINESLMFKRNEFTVIYKLENEDELSETETFSSDYSEENDLLELIEQLPEGYRTVFLLHVVDGYSHKEIADNLNIAEGTSRSQFFKARKLLQKKMGNYYGKAIGT